MGNPKDVTPPPIACESSQRIVGGEEYVLLQEARGFEQTKQNTHQKLLVECGLGERDYAISRLYLHARLLQLSKCRLQ